MKMADSEKAEEFVDAECPLECLDEAQSATASVQGEQDEHLKTETTTSTSSPPREREGDSPLNTEGEQSLLSMPCLMKELRRDSPESQNASTGSDKPVSHDIYESDSSNPCMLSPSSSGHLADSDTLSSGEEGAAPPAGEAEGNMETSNDPGQASGRQASATSTGGRKSRRSRSESEMPPNAMAAKKNRCQPTAAAAGGQEKQTNGKLGKVKGHRSQKHKERMRLLRQKREAAARKKYNLLQDSSTSDSELTCDSSTSSSEDDDDDTSGGSKTIKTDISAGFRRASERSRVGAQIHGLLESGTWDRNGIGSVLEEAMTRFAVMQRQTEERFRVWMEKLAHLDSDDSSKRSSDALEGQQQGGRPSPPSSYLPSSESAETMAAYMLARENNTLTPTPINNNILPEVTTQNGNLGVPDPGLLNV
ncbi:protein ARK2N isoform 2-T2 [Tautogolabrus adspersus]